ncbi:hypothetical protein HXZ66_08495 [Bacillus sp. A116_S68]|nr:hypothetical protein HXZ66_08495 [Bacillus sp. A116_S68]
MAHVTFRAGLLVSILMFGFILGILYSDNGVSVGDLRFHTEEIEEEEPNIRYRLKETDNNFIQMEDDEGLVIYHGGDKDLHGSLPENGTYKLKENEVLTFQEDQPAPLFTELGVKTADALEQAFSRMLSVFDGQ